MKGATPVPGPIRIKGNLAFPGKENSLVGFGKIGMVTLVSPILLILLLLLLIQGKRTDSSHEVQRPFRRMVGETGASEKPAIGLRV